jgi:hypothetical protein
MESRPNKDLYYANISMMPSDNFKYYSLTSGSGTLTLPEYSKAIVFGDIGVIRCKNVADEFESTPSLASSTLLPIVTKEIDQDNSTNNMPILVFF